MGFRPVHRCYHSEAAVIDQMRGAVRAAREHKTVHILEIILIIKLKLHTTLAVPRRSPLISPLPGPYTWSTRKWGVVSVRTNIEERACDLAAYIIDNKATVRAAATQFGISKSTVHTDAT